MKQTMKIGENEIILNGLKKEIEYVRHDVLHRLGSIKSYQRELTGTIGQEERSRDSWVMFGGGFKLRDEGEFIAKRDAFLQSLGTEVKCSDLIARRKEVYAIYDAHVCVVDSRTTPEQNAERDRKIAEANRQYKEQQAAIREVINLHDNDGEQVELPEGMMMIVIGAYFDDSDPMTDYYSRHNSLVDSYAVAYVRKGARREDIMRQVIAQVPELKSLSWDWKIEEYSMGHGTYMESEAIGTVKKEAYDGRDEVTYWYELKFTWADGKPYDKSRFYVGDLQQANQDAGGSDQSAAGSIGKVSRNVSKNGVEIKFPGKPSQAVLDQLHSAGFRWSRFAKVWYKTYSEYSWAQACKIAGADPNAQQNQQLEAERESEATASYINAQEEAAYERNYR